MFTLWFTGLSGSGKSTLSQGIFNALSECGMPVELLDGDIIRKQFSAALGYSKQDRNMNVLRLGYISSLLNKHGVAVIVAAIAPYSETRQKNRELLERYIEVFCDCPLDVLIQRDPKGLYKRALAGEISNFTGISDPYEAPERPEVRVDTGAQIVQESLGLIINHLEQTGLLPRA